MNYYVHDSIRTQRNASVRNRHHASTLTVKLAVQAATNQRVVEVGAPAAPEVAKARAAVDVARAVATRQRPLVILPARAACRHHVTSNISGTTKLNMYNFSASDYNSLLYELKSFVRDEAV